MFQIHVHGPNRNSSLQVTIANCPRNGIAAIDFRRAAGLPEAPNSDCHLPPVTIESELLVRDFGSLADADANIELVLKSRLQCWLNSNSTPPSIVRDRASILCLSPAVIRDYLANQCEGTVRGILADLAARDRAEEARANAELVAALEKIAQKEREKAAREAIQARDWEIYGPEIEALRMKVADLESECERLQAGLNSLADEDTARDEADTFRAEIDAIYNRPAPEDDEDGLGTEEQIMCQINKLERQRDAALRRASEFRAARMKSQAAAPSA